MSISTISQQLREANIDSNGNNPVSLNLNISQDSQNQGNIIELKGVLIRIYQKLSDSLEYNRQKDQMLENITSANESLIKTRQQNEEIENKKFQKEIEEKRSYSKIESEKVNEDSSMIGTIIKGVGIGAITTALISMLEKSGIIEDLKGWFDKTQFGAWINEQTKQFSSWFEQQKKDFMKAFDSSSIGKWWHSVTDDLIITIQQLKEFSTRLNNELYPKISESIDGFLEFTRKIKRLDSFVENLEYNAKGYIPGVDIYRAAKDKPLRVEDTDEGQILHYQDRDVFLKGFHGNVPGVSGEETPKETKPQSTTQLPQETKRNEPKNTATKESEKPGFFNSLVKQALDFFVKPAGAEEIPKAENKQIEPAKINVSEIPKAENKQIEPLKINASEIPPQKESATKISTKGPKKFSEEVESAIGKASDRYDVDLNYMRTLAQIESGGNPSARNDSGAKGLYQFIPKTAKAYDIAGKEYDPSASAEAAAKYAKESKGILEKAGIEATPELLYMAHQQGPQGTIDLYKAAKENKGWNELPTDLKRNMAANAGEGKSAKEFLDFWSKNYAAVSSGEKTPTISTARKEPSTIEKAIGYIANLVSGTAEASEIENGPKSEGVGKEVIKKGEDLLNSLKDIDFKKFIGNVFGLISDGIEMAEKFSEMIEGSPIAKGPGMKFFSKSVREGLQGSEERADVLEQFFKDEKFREWLGEGAKGIKEESKEKIKSNFGPTAKKIVATGKEMVANTDFGDMITSWFGEGISEKPKIPKEKEEKNNNNQTLIESLYPETTNIDSSVEKASITPIPSATIPKGAYKPEKKENTSVAPAIIAAPTVGGPKPTPIAQPNTPMGGEPAVRNEEPILMQLLFDNYYPAKM